MGNRLWTMVGFGWSVWSQPVSHSVLILGLCRPPVLVNLFPETYNASRKTIGKKIQLGTFHLFGSVYFIPSKKLHIKKRSAFGALIMLRINVSPKRLELQRWDWSHSKANLKGFPTVTYFYIFHKTGLCGEGSKTMQIPYKYSTTTKIAKLCENSHQGLDLQ